MPPPSGSGENLPDDLPADPVESYRPPPAETLATAATPSESRVGTMSRWSVSRSEGEHVPAGEGAVFPTGEPAYRLRHVVGRGGMGEVWEAVQVSLGRVLAVKRIRAERIAEARSDVTESERLAREFQQEAVVAAQLEHPNIVPVHDLGFDEAGEPLLAMKLVHGDSWRTRLRRDFETLPPSELLARHLPILVQMAQAVAFAHSKGIIHRDLKPAQVMLGEFGEVLLMDWGLAVLIDAPPPDVVTEGIVLPSRESASSPAGTPALMAPEQTVGNGRGLGVWTDIYLLGGTLYFLLAGSFPHEGATGAAAMRRAATGNVQSPAERAPDREMPAELVTLCMTALAANPADRTPSAKAFIAAIEDYLSGAGRQRESLAITGEVAARLGAVKGSYEEHGEQLAKLRRAELLWRGNPAVPSLVERVLSTYGRDAIAASDLVLARVQIEQLEGGPLRSSLTKELHDAEQGVRGRERQRRIATAAVLVLLFIVSGLAFWANLQRAEAQRQRAEAEQQTRNTRAALEVASAERDRARVALATAEEQRKLAIASAQRAVRARGDAEGMIQYILTDLQEKLMPVGRLDVVEGAANLGIEYFEKLPPEDVTPDTKQRHALALRQRGEMFYNRGKVTPALADFDAGLAMMEALLAEHPDDPAILYLVAGSRRFRAAALESAGRDNEAAGEYAQDLAIMKKLAEGKEEIAPKEHVYDLYSAYHSMGRTLLLAEKHGEALDNYLRCLAILEALQRRKLMEEEVAFSLAKLHNDMARAYTGLRDFDKARAEYELNISQMRALATRDPENTTYALYVGVACSWYAGLLRDLGEFRNAEPLLRENVEAMKKLVKLEPDNLQWLGGLASAHAQLCNMQNAAGMYDPALASARLYHETMTQLIAKAPEVAAWQVEYASSIHSIGLQLSALGRHEEAKVQQEQFIEELAKLRVSQPNNRDVWQLSGLAASDYASVLRDLKDYQGALKSCLDGVEFWAELVRREPANPDNVSFQAQMLNKAAAMAKQVGDAKLEADCYDKTITLLLPLEPETKDQELRNALARALLERGRVAEAKPVIGRIPEGKVDEKVRRLVEGEASK